MKNTAVIATNRFGLGARHNELTQAQANPKAWLKKQLYNLAFNDDLPHSADILKKIYAEKQLKKANKMSGIVTPKDTYLRDIHKTMSMQVVQAQLVSSQSMMWRLFDFFSNHFSVTAHSRKMAGLSVTLEREAIAPNLLGSFESLLQAVIKHPAMLLYLNNERSIGPNSAYGKKKSKGLNENLAREILELHSLGVNSGYSQMDVTEFAKAITGWGINDGRKGDEPGFKFSMRNHEPGTRQVLGKNYQQRGVKQGEFIISALAQHPSTARHICYKLAHHFISDEPPENLLNKMVATWQASHGNIKAVMTTLIDAEESWHDQPIKLKTPREFLVSALRAIEPAKFQDKWLWSSLKNMGQQPFQAGSPAGFSDNKQDWSGASALMAKIDWVANVVKKERKLADKIMANTLANTVSKHTYQHVMRAESRSQALALLLLSPEFLTR